MLPLYPNYLQFPNRHIISLTLFPLLAHLSFFLHQAKCYISFEVKCKVTSLSRPSRFSKQKGFFLCVLKKPYPCSTCLFYMNVFQSLIY